MSIKDVIAPFAVWKRAFEKPYTISKPIDERPGAERYRGFHINDGDKCIGCGTCEVICQNEAIDLVPVKGVEANNGDSGLRPQIDYGRCCWCALCVDVCTTSSLRMSNEYVWVDQDPEVFRFVPGYDKKPWDDRKEGYRRDSDNYSLLNYDRVDMKAMEPGEGIKSFAELIQGYSREQAVKEADRCVECGICVASCPAHMDIPGYIRAVREGNTEEGLRLLYKTNPFPASCGRVCTHRCEDVCAIGHQGDPLAIRWLKRYIADQVDLGNYANILGAPEEDSGKHIAIIGAGPGGLSAAYYLRMIGHKVTVYEGREAAGGMLRYGIPEYRLPYDQLDKDVQSITDMGVDIKYNTLIGQELSFKDLAGKHDALFFSTGLDSAYGLGVEGENLPGIITGLSILEDVTNGKDPELGDKVVVIGGGNVAMDAARTARRYGAEVTILYRRRIVDMPADQEEIDEALEEGVIMVPQAIPMKVETAASGKPVMTWGHAEMVDQGAGQRPKPVLIENSTELTEADTIVAAIGQGSDYQYLPEEGYEGVEIKRYSVVIDNMSRTGNAKIFAGGDIANSVKDAVSAIADGHAAAIGIDKYLQALRS
ncbi:FAD-dependent oxidoreductase [Oceanispirochaeta sp. M2]|nr:MULTISPECIES: FAD-dependent oxidoreductase [unclassified Oceanispirochaeta]MBF9014342.1 FAD-dependent oxidoreductase [Oceanispirochaeta sp. M2]NPD71228.1 FAD-dependent oxidoreductase [Oceanispirochaeta sp. M1]RDG33614.1 4Fe-4S dicluster domain-containing protein [Oceanispirochaeta sp. M1]